MHRLTLVVLCTAGLPPAAVTFTRSECAAGTGRYGVAVGGCNAGGFTGLARASGEPKIRRLQHYEAAVAMQPQPPAELAAITRRVIGAAVVDHCGQTPNGTGCPLN
jgi:hypothetical protein